MKLTSWNRAAKRFIDPPKYEWTAVTGAKEYQVQFCWRAKPPITALVRDPVFDFAPYWPQVPMTSVDWVVVARDAEGRVLDQTAPIRFARAPDFKADLGPQANWEESALRYAEWLLSRGETEDGHPRYLYTSGESLFDTRYHPVVYPALHHSSLVFFFSEVSRRFGHTPVGRQAGTSARTIGEWLLEHTLDAGFRCARFPLSTYVTGSDAGVDVAEKNAITLFRAARVGVAMLTLYRSTGQRKYLAYAEHLARILAEFQQPDGSWSYRVDPRTGGVVERYTSAAICFVKFFETLHVVTGSQPYQPHIDAAVRWTLENPAQTNLWQGMYEDIREMPLYSNLQNQDALEVVRYLCRQPESCSDAVAVAQRILRFVEDQFVVFGAYETHLPGQPVHPTVMEQYRCYWAMPGHTGNYVRSLMALHEATGLEVYRLKAIAAANAITRLQQPDGRYSTWGVDYRTGRPLKPDSVDWYGNGARAAYALLRWSEYCERLEQKEDAS